MPTEYAEGDIAAYFQAHALFLGIILVTCLLAYVVYRIVKERRRRIKRREYEDNHPHRREDWYSQR